MINIKINNQNITLKTPLNIIQACEINDINIPKFCYHESLSIAGNCRMCLVEIKNVAKPAASCALPVSNNMEIFTNTKLVKKAREGILEFILINHPLDCPICDQGGECDLQDQSLIYGNDKGRYYELKRSVSDKNCGFFVKTIMTRCIQCTRCVRFMREKANVQNFGIIGRGNTLEISQYKENYLYSEISANVIDLCPVGALTAKPYAFLARPWELTSFNVIDFKDPLNPPIRVDMRDNKILRILPRRNLYLNYPWISDTTRFDFDGFWNNRILKPYSKYSNSYKTVSWLYILNFFKNLKTFKINYYLGDHLDADTVLYIRKTSHIFGNSTVNTSNSIKFNNDFRYNYILERSFYESIEKYENLIIFSDNLKTMNPLFNQKIKNCVDKGLKVFVLGSDQSYVFKNYNFLTNEIMKIFKGKSLLNNILIKAKNNVIIFDPIKMNSLFGFADLTEIKALLKKYNVDCFMINNNSYYNALCEFNVLNCVSNFEDKSYDRQTITSSHTKNELFYNLNGNINEDFEFYVTNTIKIYQGTNFPKTTQIYNYLLPSASVFETDKSVYTNFFGLIQRSKPILHLSDDIRPDIEILYAVFRYIIPELRMDIHYLRVQIWCIFHFFRSRNSFNVFKENNFNYFCIKNKYKSIFTNFYKLNNISKSSLVMNQCYLDSKKYYTNFNK